MKDTGCTGRARVFAVPVLKQTVLIATGLLLVSLVASTIRVLPILLRPGTPPSFLLILARGMALMSLEMALFVAPPIAWAFVASRLVAKGEARALMATGARPHRIVAGALPVGLVTLLLALLAGVAWGREAVAPGLLVRDLLAEGKRACLVASARGSDATVQVPLLMVSWVCRSGSPPLAIASLPDSVASSQGGLAAERLTVSDDLRHLEAERATLLMATEGGLLRLHVGAASIRGGDPLGHPSNLRPMVRAGLLSILSFSLTLVVAGVVISRRIASALGSVLLGAVGPVSALLVFSALERQPSSPLLYGAVPLAAILGVVAASAGLGRAAR